ncbi:ceramide synthase 6-like [Hyalella azteca]|uniref:Ceramide synthase 6-like n=1 Tax=Hyalella azteca TaxID=294128 RepID=A0A979FW85_HYAAZ|nr:ceramide synthase 6-like [Hyalella azteca]
MTINILSALNNWFWSEKIWLPPNTTWADRVSTPENQLPNFMDLWTYPFALAVVFNIIRYGIMNPQVYGPIAERYGIKNIKPKSVVPNPVLEALFKKHNKKIPEAEITRAARQLTWSERKVERWLRARGAMNRINTYTKFLECAWQLTYYTLAFIFGLYILSDKIWLHDITYCWKGYPHYKLDNDVWLYYMISLGFYWGTTATHFLETRRKDFYQMLGHHLITIALMVFSFTCNFSRIGSLTLVVHDIADIPLQLSKLFIYLKWKKCCDITFTLFALLWMVTRCGYFPVNIVGSTLLYAHTVVPMHPVYYIFNLLLSALAVLHFYWAYFIIRIIVNTARKGVVEDDRSSSDGEVVEEDQDDGVLKKES